MKKINDISLEVIKKWIQDFSKKELAFNNEFVKTIASSMGPQSFDLPIDINFDKQIYLFNAEILSKESFESLEHFLSINSKTNPNNNKLINSLNSGDLNDPDLISILSDLTTPNGKEKLNNLIFDNRKLTVINKIEQIIKFVKTMNSRIGEELFLNELDSDDIIYLTSSKIKEKMEMVANLLISYQDLVSPYFEIITTSKNLEIINKESIELEKNISNFIIKLVSENQEEIIENPSLISNLVQSSGYVSDIVNISYISNEIYREIIKSQ